MRVPIIISHRGNTNGPIPSLENTRNAIDNLLEMTDYYLEVDVWGVDDRNLAMGHDSPAEPFPVKYLINYAPRLYCHCKDFEAALVLENLTSFGVGTGCHYFLHDQDPAVLTSDRLLWTYPGHRLTERSIVVLGAPWDVVGVMYSASDLANCAGICTDYPEAWERHFKDNPPELFKSQLEIDEGTGVDPIEGSLANLEGLG